MYFDFPTLLVLLTLVTGLVWLLDSLFFAPKRRDRGNAREPLLVEYSRSFFPVILIVLILRSFLIEPFRIPSGSMMPTLLIGDFILVNKYAYGIRLPVINKRIIDLGSPQRGDVVVFRYPENPRIDYIKRVVAIPGDTLSYRRKTLLVNGQPAVQTPLGIYIGIGSGSSMTGALEHIEKNAEDAEYRILINPMVPDFPAACQVLAKEPIVIPEGHYFMVGDNRDNSNDSRCWGLVPEEHLAGRAFAIWMNWDSRLPGFPIAWERIGSAIR